MSVTFNGLRLRDIREANGWSRHDLADHLEVSEQTVWQYEVGEIVPRFQILVQLTTLFGVSVKYFQEKNLIAQRFDERHVAYRANLRSSAKKSRNELAFLNRASDLLDSLTTNVSFPNENIKQLQKATVQLRRDAEVTIDQIANMVRVKLGIDNNNSNLMESIENAGVFVIERNLHEDIDAYSSWSQDDIPFIVLENGKFSGTRRNFDLAHELGHLLMHRDWNFSMEAPKEYRKAEQEANDFAAAMLMPADLLETLIKTVVVRPTIPDQYLPIKVKLNVSLAAIGVRATRLGILNGTQERYFFASMARKKYRKREPEENKIPYVRPGRIRAIVEAQVNANPDFLNKLLSKKGIKQEYFEESLGIETSFINKFFADTAGRIVPLRRNSKNYFDSRKKL